MIDVQQITKRYGQHTAIDRVTFSVAKGEVLAFLGPNGAGKTTTMRILTCFMPPTEGRATVAGFDCLDQPLEVKRRIGYLPETPERLGLGSVQHRLIGNLSRGYRQRVGLAQALIHDPPVLILDEPTVGLDPKQIIEIRELIKSLAGSHSVILSTHILPEATAVCQRVVIISSGRIVAEDTPDRLSTRLRHSEKIALTLTRAPADVEAQLRQVDGVLQVHANGPAGHFLLETQLGKDVRENIARLTVTSNWGLVELKLISMTLEDVFLKLTRHEEGLPQNTGPATAPAGDVNRKGMDVPS